MLNKLRMRQPSMEKEESSPEIDRVASSRLHMKDSDYDDLLRKRSTTMAEERMVIRPTPTSTTGKCASMFKRNSSVVIFLHLTKSIFGPMIMSLPFGFCGGGLLVSGICFVPFVLFITCSIVTLMWVCDYLSLRENAAIISYDQVAYVAFLTCSNSTIGFARTFRRVINILLILTRFDACSIFVIFVSTTLRKVLSAYDINLGLGIIVMALLPILFGISSFDKLNYITPFSLIANFCLWTSVFLSFYFISTELETPEDHELVGDFLGITYFFSIILFSMSGLSVSINLRGEMDNPEHFLGFPGVLCASLTLILVTYGSYGFLGCWKFVDSDTEGVIMNLPTKSSWANTTRILACIGVLFTYPIVFYIPFSVLWNNYIKPHVHFENNVLLLELFIKYMLISLTALVGYLVPYLGPMFALKGSFFHTQLEIIYPAVIEYCAYWPDEGFGAYNLRFLAMLFRVTFGLFLLFSGVATSIISLLEYMEKN